VGKSGVLKHKSGNISETRRGKVTMGGYTNSPTLFRMVPPPTPYGLTFPRLGVRNPQPELQLILSQEWAKRWTSHLADTFIAYIRTKCPLKILEKKERGRIQGVPKFFRYPYYQKNR